MPKSPITIENNVSLKYSTILCNKLKIYNCSSKESLFYAQKNILIQSGTHQSQFYSSDSIKIEKDALFPKSNLWVCHRKLIADSILTGQIIFNTRHHVNGHVIVYSDTTSKGNILFAGPSIILKETKTFTGSLITDGDISLNSVSINGYIWARSIVTKQNDISYKNWLFNIKLNPLKGENSFPLLGELPAKIVVVSR